jgi:hypothetical protein
MRSVSVGLTALLLAPGVAVAGPRLSTASVFSDATLLMQVLMVALVVAMIAAVGVAGAKVARGSRLAGGSAFVSALRLGGPLLGLMGAIYTLLMMFIGMANAGMDVPMAVLSPGFAEASLLFLLGLLAGVVGVVCHWVIDARIDRTVLGA